MDVDALLASWRSKRARRLNDIDNTTQADSMLRTTQTDYSNVPVGSSKLSLSDYAASLAANDVMSYVRFCEFLDGTDGESVAFGGVESGSHEKVGTSENTVRSRVSPHAQALPQAQLHHY